MKTVFLVNPSAGKRDPREEALPPFLAYWQAQGAPFEVRLTEAPGHGEQVARQLAAAGEELRLYAVGGDGTFREAAAGAAGCPNLHLGVIP